MKRLPVLIFTVPLIGDGFGGEINARKNADKKTGVETTPELHVFYMKNLSFPAIILWCIIQINTTIQIYGPDIFLC